MLCFGCCPAQIKYVTHSLEFCSQIFLMQIFASKCAVNYLSELMWERLKSKKLVQAAHLYQSSFCKTSAQVANVTVRQILNRPSQICKCKNVANLMKHIYKVWASMRQSSSSWKCYWQTDLKLISRYRVIFRCASHMWGKFTTFS